MTDRRPKRIAALVSGGGTNLQAVMDAIKRGEINGRVELVIASNPDAYALTRAAGEGIPSVVLTLDGCGGADERDAAILKLLREYKIDIVLLAGYLGAVGGSVIDEYAGRIINVHPSLLPAFGGRGFYGLKVHEAVLNRGVKITGATVHFVERGLDEGRIILQKAVTVRAGDTPESLQRRVMERAERVIFPRAVAALCGNKAAAEK